MGANTSPIPPMPILTETSYGPRRAPRLTANGSLMIQAEPPCARDFPLRNTVGVTNQAHNPTTLT
jgi:hypothetical protein